MRPPLIQLSVCLLLTLNHCDTPRPPLTAAVFEQPKFTYRASSLLFFRNTRSYYYHQLMDTLPPLEVYRWKKYQSRPAGAQLQPLLLLNIRQDRAVLLAELRLADGRRPGSFRLLLERGPDSTGYDTLTLHSTDPPRHHHRVLARVYQAAERGDKIRGIPPGARAVDLLVAEQERADFCLIVRDYLRLTGAID